MISTNCWLGFSIRICSCGRLGKLLHQQNHFNDFKIAARRLKWLPCEHVIVGSLLAIHHSRVLLRLD